MKRVNLSKEAKRLKIEKDQAKIVHYKKLQQDLLRSNKAEEYTLERLGKTTELLALNPEFYTIWNYRREILLDLFNKKELDLKTSLEDDLKLVLQQLKKFPKCYWIWNHRAWCLGKLQEAKMANWDFELGIVSKLLEMDSRNFHGWQYRRFVVQNIEQNSKEILSINLKEFDYTTTKINKNISNFSAWHNRSKLIIKIYHLTKESNTNVESETITLFENPLKLLQHELNLIKTGMFMDSDDTSIWLYLLWLLTEPLFVDYLKKENQYIPLLQEQLKTVEELNELEKDDHINNWDNVWCLKSIIVIKGLIKQQNNETLIDDEIKSMLQKLIEYDPLRKGRYLDQLNGVVSII